jgi:hypothetical protein
MSRQRYLKKFGGQSGLQSRSPVKTSLMKSWPFKKCSGSFHRSTARRPLPFVLSGIAGTHASAILFVAGDRIFSRASAGGREEFYTNSARELQRQSLESENLSASYYRKSIGVDKSDEPTGNSE